MATGQELKEEKEWAKIQGQIVTMLNKDRARGTWYRPDGLAIPNLPVDPYHREKYRAKGWTLKEPGTPVETQKPIEAVKAEAPAVEKVVAKPPRHIHVMAPEIGSPCLVLGCTNLRQKPKGTFVVPGHKKNHHKVKETANAR